MNNFDKWLDTFLEEKNIDLNEEFEIEQVGWLGKNRLIHFMSYGYVVDFIKWTCLEEKKAIKNMLVKIDFQNGDVKHYLRHLGQALVSEGCKL